MDATADHDIRPVRSFLAIRNARVALTGSALCGVLAAFMGTWDTGLPTAVGNGVQPLWRLLALGAGVLPVMSLHSRLADLEVVATARFRACQGWYLALATVIGAGAFLAVAALGLPFPVVGTMARALPGWIGLALLAGVAIGWRLAWTLPIFVVALLAYWGYAGGHYRWWEFSARPVTDAPSLLLSLGLLGAGLIAYAATPWRRRGRRTPRRIRHSRDRVTATCSGGNGSLRL